jgi:phenylacetate-coenzyme A ligase PaaK-like adenylate-forming protein
MISHIIKHIVAPLDAMRQKSDHYTILRSLRESQFWGEERLRHLVYKKLNRIIRYAYLNCSFYKNLYNNVGYSVEDVIDESSIRILPTITKDDIRFHIDQMRSPHFPIEELIVNKTGGTTGEQMKFYVDRNRWASRTAATLRHNEWASFSPGDKYGLIWGPFWGSDEHKSIKSRLRRMVLDRALIMNEPELSMEMMTRYYRAIKTFQPKVLLSYSHLACIFATFVKTQMNQANWKPITFNSVITTSELLTEPERSVIEEVFDTKVFNRYGSREVSVIASECSEHNGLHVNAENIYAEILDLAGRHMDGGAGEILLTDLGNFGMPLIRYRIRDVGVNVEGKCGCGRGLPRIDILGGRLSEYIRLSDGLIPGTEIAIRASQQISGILQLQFRQNRQDCLTIRVVRNDLTYSESQLIRFLETNVGQLKELQIEYVDGIHCFSSSKFQYCVSEVPDSA